MQVLLCPRLWVAFLERVLGFCDSCGLSFFGQIPCQSYAGHVDQICVLQSNPLEVVDELQMNISSRLLIIVAYLINEHCLGPVKLRVGSGYQIITL